MFRNALKKNDNVLVLLNHNYNRVLASTKDGNAVLEEDNIGLRAEITITDSEVVQKARDGKLTGWSFGFIANDDEMSYEGKDEIRTVTNMQLLEVSILDDTKAPAYYGTSIASRMEGGAGVVHIRAVDITETEEQKEEQSVSIDELAALVAAKVIEALKAEEKAETEEPEETEEQTEEVTEEEEQTEETTEETEEETENEERAVSNFEARLAELMK